jgi:hypothetical protein
LWEAIRGDFWFWQIAHQISARDKRREIIKREQRGAASFNYCVAELSAVMDASLALSACLLHANFPPDARAISEFSRLTASDEARVFPRLAAAKTSTSAASTKSRAENFWNSRIADRHSAMTRDKPTAEPRCAEREW